MKDAAGRSTTAARSASGKLLGLAVNIASRKRPLTRVEVSSCPNLIEASAAGDAVKKAGHTYKAVHIALDASGRFIRVMDGGPEQELLQVDDVTDMVLQAIAAMDEKGGSRGSKAVARARKLFAIGTKPTGPSWCVPGLSSLQDATVSCGLIIRAP